MNSVEFRQEDDTEVKVVKAESLGEEGRLGCSRATSVRKMAPECSLNCQSSKRKQVSHMSDGLSNEAEIITTLKKRKLIPETLLSCMRNRDSESSNQSNFESLTTSSEYNATSPGEEEETVNEFATSYKKPLYGISHKITEKRNPVTSDLLISYDLYDKANQVSPSTTRMFNDFRKRETGGTSIASPVSDDSNIYSLIQKMFFTLNTLNSNMSQLHSKVDLLSLEVSRIKKKVSPQDMVAEFHPPPEYQLTSAELQQVMDQSTSAGDLACRLVVQLFPELFGNNAFSRSCSTCGFLNKNKLESLHLQLIRNYVEACHPSVKSNTVWQVDVLPQINDFFNRFWAEREMESSHHGIQASSFFESQPCQNSHFVETKEQVENMTLERANAIVSEYALNAQDLNEFLEEASSPGEFSVFLLHRLFPEIFNQRKLGDRCFGEPENFVVDPHRLQLIRQYTEIYFPDVQEEDVWLQQCVQRINDELESVFMDGSECDDIRDDCYDSNLPDDLSLVKVEDGSDTDKPGRRSKKIWLVPFDFDNMDIPAPDFEVPFPQFLLNKEQIKNIYETSLSIGNFASRLLVHLFPELFTHENLRKQYNCSGSLGKKQLDPVRIKLIRHYVQMLYPRARNDRVWTLEFVGKLDERCRRRDTEQRRSYQQQRKVYVPMPERTDFVPFELNSERYRDLIEGPPLPPERSTKDFCKIPLDKIIVPPPDFSVPSVYLLSDKEIRDIVQQSLSVGNFAARLLVRLFPELFTPENLRLQYNHSGACNKKQLDPVRLRLIRHYVEAVYPVDKMEEVWHYECIPSIDERCRRPNRKKCDILKKATKNQINIC